MRGFNVDSMSSEIFKDADKIVPCTPAIALIKPKFAHNLGVVVRAASCFDVSQIWFTGNRIAKDLETKSRIPREERMKGYKDVSMIQCDYFWDRFKKIKCTPVAIEITDSSELLTDFEHPEDALYVFGPEDGSIDSMNLRFCHRFVSIPSNHCLNLSAAVSIVLADRKMKRQRAGLEERKAAFEMLKEDRGLAQTENKKPEFVRV